MIRSFIYYEGYWKNQAKAIWWEAFWVQSLFEIYFHIFRCEAYLPSWKFVIPSAGKGLDITKTPIWIWSKLNVKRFWYHLLPSHSVTVLCFTEFLWLWSAERFHLFIHIFFSPFLILQHLVMLWRTWRSMKKPHLACGCRGRLWTPEMSVIINWPTSVPEETEHRRW